VTIHGVALEPGARLNVVVASANRDERRFADPDVLRLDRDARDQVAFGDGIHRCFGAQFGRLQARVAIERLLERAPLIARVDLLGDPEWRSTWAIRGLRRLWLRGGPH
jgi:cytochrome P450